MEHLAFVAVSWVFDDVDLATIVNSHINNHDEALDPAMIELTVRPLVPMAVL